MGRRKQFAKDVAYTAAAKYSGIFINMAISVVLARLLSPTDYGVIGLTTVFVAFFGLFGNMGFGSAIIQRHDLTREDYKDIFGITLWVGISLGGLFFLAAPFIADFYNKDVLKPVCRLFALNMVITSLNSVPDSLLSKSKKFNVLAVRQVSLQLICGGLSIWAAFAGWGVYALVLSTLSSSFLILCANTLYVRLPIHIFPSLKPLKKIFSFSIYLYLGGFVNYIGNNLSSLLVGKVMSLADLGNYNKATGLVNMPMSNITGVITPVLYPYMAEINNDRDRMYQLFSKLNRFFIMAGFLLATILCMCSREIILILYGPKWASIIICFAICTVVMAVQASQLAITSALEACGDTHSLFQMGNVNTAVAFVGMLIGVFAFRSIEGLAAMSSASATFSCINCIYVGYRKAFNKSPKGILLYGLKFVVFFIVVSLSGILVTELYRVNIVISLITKVAAWFILSVLFLKVFTDYDPRQIIGSAIDFIKSRRQANA